MAVFSFEIPTSGGTEREKKRKKVDSGAAGEGWRAAGDGIGADADGGRRPCGMSGGGPGWWYWCGVNQRLKRHRVSWCFLMWLQIYFAPLASLHRSGGAGGMVGSRAAWQGYTPPLMVYEGTISRFSLQKFFFGFRVALGQCRLAKLLVYVIECV